MQADREVTTERVGGISAPSPTMQMLAISPRPHQSHEQPTSSVPVSPIQSPERERALPPKPPAAILALSIATLVAAPSTDVAAAGERTRSPPGPSKEQLAAWPHELTKPLPATVVARMLLDSHYQPGQRPHTFDPLGGTFVFKERLGCRGSCKKGDRWHNSGGKAGAREMVVEGGAVRVRRRYGSITKRGCVAWRFHEYTLMRKARMEPPATSNPTVAVAASPSRTEAEETAIDMITAMGENGPTDDPHQPAPTAAPPLAAPCGEWVEERSCGVFHVMPSRPRQGRTTLEEESGQAELWAQLDIAPQLARLDAQDQ